MHLTQNYINDPWEIMGMRNYQLEPRDNSAWECTHHVYLFLTEFQSQNPFHFNC